MHKLLVASFLFLAVPACAHIQGARSVGTAKAKTWVFINSTDPDASGVYRCTDPGNGQPPVCIRAVMKH